MKSTMTQKITVAKITTSNFVYFCLKCQQDLEYEWVFCSKCGIELNGGIDT